jgi:hypothetical protein
MPKKRWIIGIALGRAQSQAIDQAAGCNQAAGNGDCFVHEFPARDFPVSVLPNQFPDVLRHICLAGA